MKPFVFLLALLCSSSAIALQTKSSNVGTAPVTTQPALPAITFSSVGVISTLQMTGSAVWSVGSDQQTGTVTLQVAANGQSRMELDLEKGTVIETQGASTSFEGQCSEVGFDGVAKAVSSNNCWRGTVWFLPQMTLQAGSGWADTVPSAAAVPNGTPTLHYIRRPSGTMSDQTAAFIARLSAFDLTLDTAGHPATLKFNVVPDDNSLTNIPTEIDFSDYRVVNGVSVPFHIQKLINNGVVLDLQIANVQINPALTFSNPTGTSAQ
jgi:hypothetical protein